MNSNKYYWNPILEDLIKADIYQNPNHPEYIRGHSCLFKCHYVMPKIDLVELEGEKLELFLVLFGE